MDSKGSIKSSCKYNFSAGPSMLPEEVMKKAQHEFLNWENSGMSVMEMSHRGKEYLSIFKKAQNNLRSLFNVPKNSGADKRNSLNSHLFLNHFQDTMFKFIEIPLFKKCATTFLVAPICFQDALQKRTPFSTKK